MVTAVEAANGVMVGMNRESASAGSAEWNFAEPRDGVISRFETIALSVHRPVHRRRIYRAPVSNLDMSAWIVLSAVA